MAESSDLSKNLSDTLLNERVFLKSCPQGLLTGEEFGVETCSITNPSANQCLVKVIAIGVDAFIRMMIEPQEDYIYATQIGGTIPAFGVGHVVKSESEKFAVGQMVTGMLKAQSYATVDASGLKQVEETGNPTAALGILAMTTGLTAWIGVHKVARVPKQGEIAVVSAATGAIGQLAVQLLKLQGCQVIGITGGKDKVTFLQDTLGVQAVDYKNDTKSLKQQLDELAPDGIDFFYDNVGGEVLDTVLLCLRRQARVVICGAVSQYSGNLGTGAVKGPSNYLKLAEKCCAMHGFNAMAHTDSHAEALEEMTRLYNSGEVKMHEHISHGIANFGEALKLLFTGGKIGKVILMVEQ